ncbi:MAG TPA: membrane dipeptidase [Thermoplasmataceae archaeon]|nr:membrane dipeptidase [Thermoplasmataceae archaeon]
MDMHEDFAFSAQKNDVVSSSQQSSLNALREFEECLVFGSIFPHIGTINERSEYLTKMYGSYTGSTAVSVDVMLEQFKLYDYFSRRHDVRIVKNAQDLLKGGVKFLLSLEGTDVLRDPYDVFLLNDLGLRCIGLTWNYDTKFAASCMSKKDYGLTGFGSEVIDIANSLGIIVDLAHASRQTILDVCSVSSRPVLVSHGNARGLQDHPRNIDDACLDAVASTNGVVGVTAIVQTLGGSKDINRLVEHAKYIASSVGWEHVGLGTDFLGISEVPSGFENIGRMQALSSLLEENSEMVMWSNPIRVIAANLRG